MDDPLRPPVVLAGSADIAAALPQLIGFPPHESVVLVALGGLTGNRIGLTVRGDLPDPAARAAVVRALVGCVATDDPAGVVVAVVSEAADVPEVLPGGAASAGLPHRGVVHDAVVALADRGIPVRDVLLVRGGRWWSYDCPRPCCAPGAGTPLPGGTSALAAASAAAGQVVARDRAALEARIAPLEGPARAATDAAVRRLRESRAAGRPPDPDTEARRSWQAVLRALRHCRPPGSHRLPDRETAAVLWALTDVRVRDRALTLALGKDAAAAEQLWTECTRRAPSPLDAAPATLLAVSAWLRGDGATASIALARALDSDPGYSLAELLADALARCLPPAELRALLVAASDDPDPVRALR